MNRIHVCQKVKVRAKAALLSQRDQCAKAVEHSCTFSQSKRTLICLFCQNRDWAKGRKLSPECRMPITIKQTVFLNMDGQLSDMLSNVFDEQPSPKYLHGNSNNIGE
jgi:hypothetical protein